MEMGARMLLRILGAALLLGLVVILAHPVYRGAARALLRGEAGASPIWASNEAYYREVVHPDPREPEPDDDRAPAH
jgi:hypothetical protein